MACSETVVQTHIRNLLLEYAHSHFTTDYVDFTRAAVTSLLSDLSQVPTTDPSALIIPADPWEKLMKIYLLKSLESYDEKLQVASETSDYIKRMLRFKGTQKVKSEAVIMDDAYAQDLALFLPDPMPTLLTRKAIKETPHAGSSMKRLSSILPGGREALIKPHFIDRVPFEQDDESTQRLNRDEVLDTSWKLLPEIHSAVAEFVRSTGAMARPGGQGAVHKNKYLDPEQMKCLPELYLDCIPSFKDNLLDGDPDAFVPIFARSRIAGSGHRPSDVSNSRMENISDLPPKIFPPVPVQDLDIRQESLFVVDGWQTLQSSPNLTTPTSSQEDQIDQLFEFSSPNTDLSPIKLLKDSKMDDVLIPQSRHIHGSRYGEKLELVGHGKSFSEFILPLLPSGTDATGVPPLPPNSRLDSPEPSTSMIGDTSSTLGARNVPLYAEHANSEAADIAQLWKDNQMLGKRNLSLPFDAVNDPKEIILKERLAVGKDDVLMEIPVLPEPTIHKALTALFLPTKFGQYIAPTQPKAAKIPHHVFFKKAKGIGHLSTQLSWTPFTLDEQEKLPTLAEVFALVDLLDRDDDLNGVPLMQLKAQVEDYLKRHISLAESPSDQTYDDERVLDQILDEPTAGFDEEQDFYRCEDIIMSRMERRRLAGINSVSFDDISSAPELEYSSDKENLHVDDAPSDPSVDSAKRGKKRSQQEDADDEEQNFVGWDGQHPEKRARDDDWTDDSGVAFFEDFQSANYLCASLQPHGSADRLFIPLHNEQAATKGDFVSLSLDSRRSGDGSQHLSQHDMEFAESTNGISLSRSRSDHHVDHVPHILSHSSPKEGSTHYDLGISSHTLGITDFARLRARKLRSTELETKRQPAIANLDTDTNSSRSILPLTAPPEIMDRATLQLPSPWESPSRPHRYLASLDVIQKQILVRVLRSRECAIDLVERDRLSGVDVIYDADAAAIYFNILALPSRCEALVTQISEQSWRYSSILIVFEAYSPSESYKNVPERDGISVYSPPVLKAIKKLRRDISLAEAYQNLRGTCNIKIAFAENVQETAKFTRYFGDLAESQDASGGVLWDDRRWLENDMDEDEENVATIDGWNRFAAFLILCQISAAELVDLNPQERLQRFGSLIGMERMRSLNAVIDRRMQELSDLSNSGSEMYIDEFED